jgi:hypothetical protein
MDVRDMIYVKSFNRSTWQVSKNRTLNHTDCEHLIYKNESCCKKIFHCYDLQNDEYIDIQVCNEWFKLKFFQYIQDKKVYYYQPNKIEHDKTYHLYNFVKNDIIDKYINTNYNDYTQNKSLLINSNLNIRLCYRPEMYYDINLKQGIEMLINLSINQRRNEILEDSIISAINKFFTLKDYAKYSNLKRQHAKLVKTVDKSSNDFILEFNEFLINLINIK